MVTLGGCLSNMSNVFTSWWVLTTCITSQESKESAFGFMCLKVEGWREYTDEIMQERVRGALL